MDENGLFQILDPVELCAQFFEKSIAGELRVPEFEYFLEEGGIIFLQGFVGHGTVAVGLSVSVHEELLNSEMMIFIDNLSYFP